MSKVASNLSSFRTAVIPPGLGPPYAEIFYQCILYQGFSLLTANRETLRHPLIAKLAAEYKRTASDIVFRFALDVGIIPLTGTTNPDHMRADLGVFDFRLKPEEVQQIERVALP